MSLVKYDKYHNLIPPYKCPECAGKIAIGVNNGVRYVYVKHSSKCQSGYRNSQLVKVN